MNADRARLERSVDTFLAAAGLADLVEITARLAVSCAADIRYVDPMVETVGAAPRNAARPLQRSIDPSSPLRLTAHAG